MIPEQDSVAIRGEIGDRTRYFGPTGESIFRPPSQLYARGGADHFVRWLVPENWYSHLADVEFPYDWHRTCCSVWLTIGGPRGGKKGVETMKKELHGKQKDV